MSWYIYPPSEFPPKLISDTPIHVCSQRKSEVKRHCVALEVEWAAHAFPDQTCSVKWKNDTLGAENITGFTF